MASYDIYGDPTAGYAVNKSTIPMNQVSYTPAPVASVPSSLSSAALNAGSSWSSGSSAPSPVAPDPIRTNIMSNPTYSSPSASVTPTNTNNNFNNVDINALVKSVADSFMANMPKYSNPYNDQLLNALNTIQNRKPFEFDATNNPALEQAQKQSMGIVRKDMAKRGRVFDTYAATKEQEAAQGLIPSYYQLGMNQYNTETQNQYQQLAAWQGADNTAYNRNQQQGQNYLQAYGVGQAGANAQINQNNTQFNQGITEAGLTGQYKGQPTVTEQDRVRQQEIEQYGTPLTPEIKQQVTVFQQMPQSIRTQVQQYDSNYAVEINRRAAVNPQDPMIPYLLAARTNKILGDPELMAKYGSSIGLSSPAIAMMAQKYQTAQLALYIDQLKAQYAQPQYQAELEKVKAEAQKAGAEAAYKVLETANLPLELKVKLAGELEKINLTKAQTGAQQANASESYANVALTGAKTNTETTSQITGKPLTTAQKNQSMSEDIAGISQNSVEDAIKELKDGKEDYIKAYGISGYKQLWDSVLANAIKEGQAQKYADYYK